MGARAVQLRRPARPDVEPPAATAPHPGRGGPPGASRMKRSRSSQPTTPRFRRRRFYGYGIPRVAPDELAGKLIVVEGADGSGRSTQIARLVEWLEGSGHATVQVGLKRSTLVSEELEQAQQGNILSRTTLSLLYATDFAYILENIISPPLQ